MDSLRLAGLQARQIARRLRPRNRAFFANFPLPKAVEKALLQIDDEDPHDPGGYCHLQKKWALASLVTRHGLKKSVEIGVYRGSSLLPTAAAMKSTGGRATGIDPYDGGVWEQKQSTDIMQSALGDDWKDKIASLDWNGYLHEVVHRVKQYGLEKHCDIVIGLSHEVPDRIEDGIDLLHIDGNHDFDAVALDVELYYPKLAPRAFVVFDDTNWEGVAPHYEDAKRTMDLVYEDVGWGILRRPA